MLPRLSALVAVGLEGQNMNSKSRSPNLVLQFASLIDDCHKGSDATQRSILKREIVIFGILAKYHLPFSDIHPKYGKWRASVVITCDTRQCEGREKSREPYLHSPFLTSIFDVDRRNLFNTRLERGR